MKRVLFVLFKKYNGILEGGGMANRRNLSMAYQLLGEENVDVVYVHDENKKRTLWNWLASVFYFPFGYYNGFLPNRVEDIIKRAHAYDAVF